jgi:hypothetical protein
MYVLVAHGGGGPDVFFLVGGAVEEEDEEWLSFLALLPGLLVTAD